jgi:tetratricopeptide (TPR) repeat protein
MIENTELQELAHALELGEGFVLHFVVCNTPAMYPQLLETVRAKTSVPIYPFTIPRDLDGLIDVWLSEQVRDLPSNAVIFLYGLADLLAVPKQDEAGYLKRHNILQQLNWQRNAYQRLQRPVVIWVRTDTMRLIALYASDFYDWRTGVFEYHPPREQCHEVIQQNLVGFDREWSALHGLSLVEKQRWLGTLQGLIDELATATTPAEQQMLAKLLNDQGELYYSLGEYELVKPCYEKALTIREQVLGRNHQEVIEIVDSLAHLYSEQEQYEQAFLLYQEVLKVTEQVLGKQHPNYARSLNNLGVLYQNQEKYDEALLLHQEALAIRERVLGKQHLHYAQSLYNLAGLYYQQGEYDKAEYFLQEVLAIRERSLGKQHLSYTSTLVAIATLYQNKGQYDKSLGLLKEALKLQKQIVDKHHPYYASIVNSLALCYQDQGEYDKALPLFQEAFSILINTLGEQHPHTKKVKENYERCLNRDSQD